MPEAEHDAAPAAAQESLLISFEDADQGPEDNLPTVYNPFTDTAAVNAGKVGFSLRKKLMGGEIFCH